LYWGTHLDNMADAARHDAIPRGRARPNTRLHERDIPTIRASTETLSQLARRFGVSPGTIKDVRDGHSWRHIC
jgi:hypothetical protein